MFSWFWLAGIIAKALVSFFNSVNLLIIMLMVMIYMHSRYLIALLYGLCLVPQSPADQMMQMNFGESAFNDDGLSIVDEEIGIDDQNPNN